MQVSMLSCWALCVYHVKFAQHGNNTMPGDRHGQKGKVLLQALHASMFNVLLTGVTRQAR